MTQAELRKLAAEVEQSQPTPEWSDIEELAQMRAEVKVDGRKRSLNFQQACEMYKQLDAEIEKLEAVKKELKNAIQPAMMVAGKEKVVAGGYQAILVTKSGSKKIVAEKLLEQGVSAMVIAKATEVGKDSQYVTIREAKTERE